MVKKIEESPLFQSDNLTASDIIFGAEEQPDPAEQMIQLLQKKQQRNEEKGRSDKEAIIMITYSITKSFVNQYEKSSTWKIGKAIKLQAHIDNMISNFKQKKSTPDWLKDKTIKYDD